LAVLPVDWHRADKVARDVSLPADDLALGGEVPVHYTSLHHPQQWGPTSACVRRLAQGSGMLSSRLVELLFAEHRLDSR
jgi:hypothetical protein